MTDIQALQLGQIACMAMRNGVEQGLTFGQARANADDAVAKAANQSGLRVPGIPAVRFLVEAAEGQLC